MKIVIKRWGIIIAPMPSLTEFTVSAAAWQADMACLKDVRRTVFILEQQVPESLEWDEFDAVSVHVLAHAQDRAIGTGRLLPDGHIGRMAAWRYRAASQCPDPCHRILRAARICRARRRIP